MLVAEFLGTATLVMVALVLSETTAVSYFIATSVAVALVMIYLVFGSVSGAHVNPAITFGMWTARKMGTLRAVSYIAAQMLGAVASWQLYQYFTNRTLPAKSVTFSTPVWVAEVVGTFVLAVAFAAIVSRGMEALQSAITYGAALFAGIIIAATASAGFLNPAEALGLRAWSSAYVLGPLIGGLVGVNLYMWLFAPAKKSRK